MNNKQTILNKFKLSLNKKTFLNPLVDLAFEIQNFNIDITPKISMGLSYDITTKKIIDYDKINGKWFKSKLAKYELLEEPNE